MQIHIQHPDGREEYVTLDDSRTLRFGTRRSADVVLQGAGIFPIHFGILLHHDAFTAVASQQARKIRVNGSRVRKAVLRDGDRMEVGATVLTVLDTEVVTIRTETPASNSQKTSPQSRPKAWKYDDTLPTLPTILDASLTELADDTAGPLDGLSNEWLDASEPPPAAAPDKQGKRHAGPIVDRGEKSPFVRLVQSVWFARVLWACAVLPLVALIGIYVGQRPTADELFRTADDAYRHEDFAQAIERFDQFLKRHPRHALANEAGMKRDLAQLLDHFDRGVDSSLLVSEIEAAAGHWSDMQHHPDAQRGLAQMLPTLVQDLTRSAQTTTERGGSRTASDARASAAKGLHLIHEYLPPPLLRSCNVDELEAALTQLEREQNQTALLDTTIEKIEQANHAGDLAAAQQRRNELLREYPQLASNARLWEVLRTAARVQAGQVKVTTDLSSSGAKATPESAGGAGVVMVPATTVVASSTVPTLACVYAADSGAVFGLDLATGRVLWRYPVGFECQETLQRIGGPAELLVDTQLQQVLSADTATGQVAWRLAFESPAAMPAIDQAHAIAVSRSGRIAELTVENGEIVWQLQLPQTLRTATALDPDAPRCYQVADDSIIYVLSRNPGACLSAHYLGHEFLTVGLPPAVVGDYLLVFEQTGPSSTEVHVLRRGDELQAVQTFETPGIVVNQPAVLGALVYLPTDAGRVQILRYDAGDRRKPFASVGEINVVDDAWRARCDVHVATAQDRLWIGSRGVRVFELASAPDSPKLLQQIWNDLRVTGPLCIQDRVVIAVGHATEQTGLSARAWDIAQGKTLWSTALSMTVIAPPLETQ